MRYIVDRIEGSFAVCEDEKGCTVDLKLSQLPEKVRSGDIISFKGGKFSIDKEAASARRAKLAAMQKSLWADDSTDEVE